MNKQNGTGREGDGIPAAAIEAMRPHHSHPPAPPPPAGKAMPKLWAGEQVPLG